MSEEKKKRVYKTVDIKGKDYVTVAERIRAFNEECPNGQIATDVTFLDEAGIVRCLAKVTPDVDKPNRYFTGHAEEDRTSSVVNKTSAVENAETSAVGRALGMMGIGILESSFATADEVTKAVNREKTFVLKGTGENQQVTRICQSCHKDFHPKIGTENFAKQCLDCFKAKAPIIPKPVKQIDPIADPLLD